MFPDGGGGGLLERAGGNWEAEKGPEVEAMEGNPVLEWELLEEDELEGKGELE